MIKQNFVSEKYNEIKNKKYAIKDKKTLKRLFKKYYNEIKNGNTEHVNDMIATIVLHELTGYVEYPINKNEITLKKLVYCFNDFLVDSTDNTYIVQTIQELSKEKELYDKFTKVKANKYLSISQQELDEAMYLRASIIWTILMLSAGIIKEGQAINSNEYDLVDFMNDQELRQNFCNEQTETMSLDITNNPEQEMSITYYDMYSTLKQKLPATITLTSLGIAAFIASRFVELGSGLVLLQAVSVASPVAGVSNLLISGLLQEKKLLNNSKSEKNKLLTMKMHEIKIKEKKE
jgi:hypothetical protein